MDSLAFTGFRKGADDMNSTTGRQSKRKCTRCGRLKNESEFRRRGKYDETKRSWCTSCIREEISERWWALKEDVLTHYSSKDYPVCAHCGETDLKELSIDHVNGGGTKHIKNLGCGSGFGFYHWLQDKKYPSNPPLQVLCKRCNARKH
jgi:hypothetical protein